MEFKKYSSLENHYQQAIINKVMFAGLSHEKVVWTMREKIHGANYSFWYDGTTMRYAKRSGFTDEFSNFFGHHVIIARYRENIKNLYAHLVEIERIEQGDTMCIYGEIAGTMDTGRKVQREVEYGDLDFYAFDIKLRGGYIDDLEVESMCFDYNIRTAPLLKVGTFEELFKTPNDFQTCVFQDKSPTEFELIYEGDNVSEGYVLKPNIVQYFDNGTRVAIKSKNEKFSEKKKHSKLQKIKDKEVALHEKDVKLLELLETFNTENRLRNVLSKVGEVKQSDFGKILNMMVLDIEEDFEKEHGPQLALDAFTVKKMLNANVSKTIGKNFGAILKGFF